MRVDVRSLDQVYPYDGNPRVIPQAAIDKVAASIRSFGFRQPIVVDPAGVIIAGHVRYRAAQQLGLASVPVHVTESLSPEQAQAYRLADNRSAQEAEWDDDQLARELDNLSIDLREVTGFDPAELEKLLPECYADLSDPGLPDLSDADKDPIQQMTFTLSDAEAEIVRDALAAAKPHAQSDGINSNANGNALAHICRAYLSHGEGA